MPKSRYVPGTNTHRWWVVLDTTDGRQASWRRSEAEAIALSEVYRISDGRGIHEHPWAAVGAVVLDPGGEEVHRWGREFDVDGPPRWPGLAPVEDARTCHNGCPIARGRYQLNGYCLNCAYLLDPEPRPVRIQQPPWEPRQDEIKQDAKDAKAAAKATTYKEPERFGIGRRRRWT